MKLLRVGDAGTESPVALTNGDRRLDLLTGIHTTDVAAPTSDPVDRSTVSEPLPERVGNDVSDSVFRPETGVGQLSLGKSSEASDPLEPWPVTGYMFRGPQALWPSSCADGRPRKHSTVYGRILEVATLIRELTQTTVPDPDDTRNEVESSGRIPAQHNGESLEPENLRHGLNNRAPR